MNSSSGYYVHQVPGRLRVKIPCIKGNAETGQLAADMLHSLDGVNSVNVNTVTGSVKVKYNPDVQSSRAILEHLTEQRLIDFDRVVTSDDMFIDAAAKAGERLGKVAFSWTVGRALEGGPLSFLAALI